MYPFSVLMTSELVFESEELNLQCTSCLSCNKVPESGLVPYSLSVVFLLLACHFFLLTVLKANTAIRFHFEKYVRKEMNESKL